MNARFDQLDHLSPSDSDFLVQLDDFAQTIEPDSSFKVDLEAELRQAHPSSSPQTAHKARNPMNFAFPRWPRRAALAACAALAIATALIVPVLASGRATGWLAALLDSTLTSKATAQTIAQAMETGQVIVRADAQDYNETTQEVRAIGNAALAYPDAQIQASADEIQYVLTAHQVILLGNVQISQRGENLQGNRAVCSLEEQQCSLTQE